MPNFIFISPNFPTNYWQFCRELKNNGLNVLGIGVGAGVGKGLAAARAIPAVSRILPEFMQAGRWGGEALEAGLRGAGTSALSDVLETAEAPSARRAAA